MMCMLQRLSDAIVAAQAESPPWPAEDDRDGYFDGELEGSSDG